jgi:N-acetylglucosaminyl-diphospho-decaprenol L-rhamnosyltransferase
MVESHDVHATLVRQASRCGFAENHNRVIRDYANKFRYVLLLNEDTEVDACTIERMVAFMDHHPRVGITGAHLVHSNNEAQSSYAAFPTVWEELLYVWAAGKLLPKRFRPKIKRLLQCMRPLLPRMTAAYLENWTNACKEAKVVDWVCGACFMVRREVIKEVGLLDEGFFIYFEETDWCKRAAEKGWLTMYIPTIRVQHHEAAGRGRLSIIEFQRSGYRYFAKHGGRIDKYLFRMGVVLNAFLLIAWSAFCWFLKPSRRAERQYAIGTYREVLRGALPKA